MKDNGNKLDPKNKFLGGKNCDWIGEIPDDWKISKIKYVAKFGSGSTPRSDKIEYYENGNINWIQSGDIYGKSEINNVKVLITDKALSENKSLKIYKAPFIVLAMYGASIGNVAISFINACTNQACCSIKTNKNTDLKFLFYWLNFCKVSFLNKAEGGGQTNISQDKIRNELFLLPPLDQQKKIADFLDNKCSKIDKLLELLTKQIKVLSEYKKSLITETVTKGLNPDKLAPSTKEEKHWKDSGINWIGEIPKDWKISRLKYLLDCPMKYGASETGITYNENLPRYIRITDITQDNKLKNEGKLSLTFEQAKGYILTTDSILFARSGATVGKTFLYLPKYGLCAFAGYLISATPNKNLMIAKWLYYYSQSNSYWNWVNTIFTQATIQNIGADKYNNMKIPLPPLEEQQEIADFLDNKCSKIDKLLENKKKQIETLKKYKKSLIYEYVTGKKEVTRCGI